MVRPLLRRVIGALDARPDLERAARLAVVLGFQTGWLWHLLIWPSDVGLLVLGASGVALGGALGVLGGLAARRRPWVGGLHVLGLPVLVLSVASGYGALQLVAVDLVARASRLGLPPSADILHAWRLLNHAVALLVAAGWGGAAARLMWLARAPDDGSVTSSAPVEQRALLTVASWLDRQSARHACGRLARLGGHQSPVTRRQSEASSAAMPPSARRPWWLVAAGLLIGWPPPRPHRRSCDHLDQ